MDRDINNLKNTVLSELNSLGQLMNLVLVPSNTGKIQSSSTTKEKNNYKIVDDSLSYKLNIHKISILSEDIILPFEEFILDLKNFKSLEKDNFNFFKQNFLQRLFFKKKNMDLINKINSYKEKYSWIIVPEKVLTILQKSECFTENTFKDEHKSRCIGKMDTYNVYKNPDNNSESIFFGNFQTSTLLVNKNTLENSIEFCINYLFVETGESIELKIT
jgi:hypothetical protein